MPSYSSLLMKSTFVKQYCLAYSGKIPDLESFVIGGTG